MTTVAIMTPGLGPTAVGGAANQFSCVCNTCKTQICSASEIQETVITDGHAKGTHFCLLVRPGTCTKLGSRLRRVPHHAAKEKWCKLAGWEKAQCQTADCGALVGNVLKRKGVWLVFLKLSSKKPVDAKVHFVSTNPEGGKVCLTNREWIDMKTANVSQPQELGLGTKNNPGGPKNKAGGKQAGGPGKAAATGPKTKAGGKQAGGPGKAAATGKVEVEKRLAALRKVLEKLNLVALYERATTDGVPKKECDTAVRFPQPLILITLNSWY